MAEGALKPLTRRQARFVEEYLVDFKALPAAHRAGYAKRDMTAGVRLLREAAVLEEINARVLVIHARLGLEAQDIREGFERIATDPRPAPEGPTVGERIAALRELGRLMGLYSERHIFVGVTLEQLLMAVEDPTALPLLETGQRAIAGLLSGKKRNGANGHEESTAEPGPEVEGGS